MKNPKYEHTKEQLEATAHCLANAKERDIIQFHRFDKANLCGYSGTFVLKNGRRKTFRGGGVYTQNQAEMNSADAINDSVGNEPNKKDKRLKRSVWNVATQGFKEAHFATFPLELIRPCILAGCPQNGVVLDIFGGAGTTSVVAEQEQRNSILIELNLEYIEIAKNRITKDCGIFTDIEIKKAVEHEA